MDMNNNTDTNILQPNDKGRIKYTISLDNRFWELLLRNTPKGKHSYSYPEALAALFQRQFSSRILMDEEWMDVSATQLSTLFGWYRQKSKDFISWCTEVGILESKRVNKRTYARVICMSIPKFGSDNDSGRSDNLSSHERPNLYFQPNKPHSDESKDVVESTNTE